MKKIIFGIFAHPDDEAFGPAGTFLLEAKAGNDIHIITLTSGQNGMNPDKQPDLSRVRLEEWREAAKRIGISNLHQLGLEDGCLCNRDMINAAERIEEIIRKELTDMDDREAELLCFDTNGISGHIDHIVATRAALLAFYRLKPELTNLKRVRLFALSKKQVPAVNTDWLYMEPGHDEHAFDETVDAQEYADEIRYIMAAHHSQRQDAEYLQKQFGGDLFVNHFFILE